MKLLTQLLCFLVFCPTLFAQEGFQFTRKKSKVAIPFKLINNLIVIPVKVNGVELNFLLDTGVEETILFSLDEKDEVELFEVQKITLKGLGGELPVEGLRASKNVLELPGLISKKQDILIVLDQEFNFSSSLGIPVNGIIGYQFFKEHLIEINYDKKKIYMYDEDKIAKTKLIKDFQVLPFTLERAKPYIKATAQIDSTLIDAKFLIDTGNSDAVWLFQGFSPLVKVPDKNFEAFLGRGFNGHIYGNRAKINAFCLDEFQFSNPVVAFPSSTSTKNVRMVDQRAGSIGGELLKRFNVIFDYKNKLFYLKKNSNFNKVFKYNISGIEIHHIGLQWITEMTSLRTELNVSSSDNSHYNQSETTDFKYKFKLKPVYEILDVRKNSQAEKAGLQKGDVILSVNNRSSDHLSLEEMNSLLKADSGDFITIVIRRNTKEMKFHFQLLEVL